LQVGRQISYLARTSATTGDAGSGSVSLEPGTVSTGLMMSILPRIVEQNRILMRISVAITDAQQPFATFGSGTNQIQLPEVETTGFLQNAVVTSGETMVLAGFEKELASTSETGTPIDGPIGILLGGAKDTSRSKELTVLILTSEILPEEPMTVIGQ
jgi:type II secretory pathway component GspD/PulD (secretin)